MPKPFLQLEERHGRSRVKELGRNGRTCSVAGNISTGVFCGHTTFLAQQRDQMVINVEFCYALATIDRKSTRLNSSHTVISYAVFCLKKKKYINMTMRRDIDMCY